MTTSLKQTDFIIVGFVKADRHPSGSVVVMARGTTWIDVYWLKRWAANANACYSRRFDLTTDKRAEARAELHYLDQLDRKDPPVSAQRRVIHKQRRRDVDAQRSRVYKWENVTILPYAAEKLDFDACKAFVREVCWVTGNRVPEVGDGRRRRSAVSFGGKIALPRHTRTKAIILHELAHEFCARNEHHGPEFVRMYIDLCGRFLKMNVSTLERSAIDMKLHVAPRVERSW